MVLAETKREEKRRKKEKKKRRRRRRRGAKGAEGVEEAPEAPKAQTISDVTGAHAPKNERQSKIHRKMDFWQQRYCRDCV